MKSILKTTIGTTLVAVSTLLCSTFGFAASEYVVAGGPAAVLGDEDSSFYQLALGEALVLDFGSVSTGTTRLEVFTFDDLYEATASLEVSADNLTFTTVSASFSDAQGVPPPIPVAAFTVATLYRYVRLTDLQTSPSPFENLGFDLDAVGRTVVPLPAAAWLFGSALFGLVAVKRRKA